MIKNIKEGEHRIKVEKEGYIFKDD